MTGYWHTSHYLPPSREHGASCETCVFGEPTALDDGLTLTCHRFPLPVVVLEGEPVQIWPQMEANDWCGEWTMRLPDTE